MSGEHELMIGLLPRIPHREQCAGCDAGDELSWEADKTKVTLMSFKTDNQD